MSQQSALSSVPDHGQVTVITMTRRRPSLLANAIRSVAGQCCDHVAEHLILVDDCLETWGSLARELPPEVRPRMVPRGPADATGPRRLGHLRDIGAALARTPWVAYLDDDDEWLPSHLHSLLATAETSGCEAVHCWRQLVNVDGSPYLDPIFPWITDEEEARGEYRRLAALGIVEPGSNVIKDCAGPEAGEADLRLVDGGAWLIATELARKIGFSYDYDAADFALLNAEDDKFLDAVLDARIPVAASRQASLVYRLGGFSNVFDGAGMPTLAGDSGSETVSWT